MDFICPGSSWGYIYISTEMMHTWSSTFQDSSAIHRVLGRLLGTQMCCLRSTCALPLLPSTVGPQRCHLQSRLGLSPCIPSFYSQWCQTLPGSTAQYGKLIPLRASPTGPGILPSLSGNQFLQRLACSSQPSRNLTRGVKKNIFSTSSAKKKKNLSWGTWTQRKYNSSVLSIRWVI